MKKKHRKKYNRSLELEQRYALQEILEPHFDKLRVLWNESTEAPSEHLNLTPDELVESMPLPYQEEGNKS